MKNKQFCNIKEMDCNTHGSSCSYYEVCSHGDAESKIEIMKSLANVQTKESLIRYLVCDGEPVDESCVGHPVLYDDENTDISDKGHGSSALHIEWKTGVLKKIDKENEWYPYHICMERKTCFGEIYHLHPSTEFAKKKPGYDYSSRKV
jgi:hypothetical protein